MVKLKVLLGYVIVETLKPIAFVTGTKKGWTKLNSSESRDAFDKHVRSNRTESELRVVPVFPCALRNSSTVMEVD